MKLIVGLGNPGPEYERTRHNAGFAALDAIIGRHAVGVPARSRFQSLAHEIVLPIPGAGKALLCKPLTYMNRSGLTVSQAVRFYKLDPEEDVLVLVDEMALPCGGFRLRTGGGHNGHNGLRNITQALGTESYARLRIGVGDPGLVPGRDYVLGAFSAAQRAQVAGVLPKVAGAAELWAAEGAVAAMNAFNVKPPKAKPGPAEGAQVPPPAQGQAD